MKYLKKFWAWWIVATRPIGNFMSQVLLTIFYVVFIWPLGIYYRFFADPLKYKKSTIQSQKSKFEAWDHPKQDIDESRKQY